MVKKLYDMSRAFLNGPPAPFTNNNDGDSDDDEEKKKQKQNQTPLSQCQGSTEFEIDDPGSGSGNSPSASSTSSSRSLNVVDSAVASEAETSLEARHLYLDFLRSQLVSSAESQIREVGLGLLPNDDVGDFQRLDQERHVSWLLAGRQLRHLADAFATSPERQSVRIRAENVSSHLESLNFENFIQLLTELFQEGAITRERILVLFFFCSDIALEALKRGFNTTFRQLIQWSLNYISTKVVDWVRRNGGWAVVLRSSLDIAYQITATCACVAFVAFVVVYIRRNGNYR